MLEHPVMNEANGDGEPAAAAAAPPPAAAPSWTDGFSAEQLALVEARGWKNPGEVVTNFHEQQKFTGVPKEQLLRIPQKDEDWPEVFDKLGRPEKPEGYEHTVPEGGDKNMFEWARGTFHEIGLTKAQGEKLLAAWDEFSNTSNANLAESLEAKLAEQQENLKRMWGGDFDNQLKNAQAGQRALELPAEVIDAMQSQVGYDTVMSVMARVGEKVGEASYVSGEGSGDSIGVMTPARAEEKINELLSDPDWFARWEKGGVTERKQMTRLTEMTQR